LTPSSTSTSTPVTVALGTSVKFKVKDGVDVHGQVKVKVGVNVNDKVDDNVQRNRSASLRQGTSPDHSRRERRWQLTAGSSVQGR